MQKKSFMPLTLIFGMLFAYFGFDCLTYYLDNTWATHELFFSIMMFVAAIVAVLVGIMDKIGLMGVNK